MQIFVRSLSGKFITLEVEPFDRIEDVKAKFCDKDDIPPDDFYFFFNNQKLKDENTVEYYSIKPDCTLILIYRPKGGCCTAKKPSNVVGFLKNDQGKVTNPLKPGKLTSRYIRNTNSSRVYEQIGGTCYAYAAASAYINTVMRIYGSKEAPSFKECFHIACYNGSKGGQPAISIQKLEEHFHYGIRCEKTKKATILDAMKISVIVSFSTSKKGWTQIAKGELFEKPEGKADGSHATVVEGYDFDRKCLICKNSWGSRTAKPRFDLKPSATHNHYYTLVYFTSDSIKGKTHKKFEPKMKKFIGQMNRIPINCAWMDENTAIYSSDYVCEPIDEKVGPYNYIGYKIEEWISIKLWPLDLCLRRYPLTNKFLSLITNDPKKLFCNKSMYIPFLYYFLIPSIYQMINFVPSLYIRSFCYFCEDKILIIFIINHFTAQYNLLN